MKTSEKTDQLIPALLSVKSEMEAVTKSSVNPHFKSRYADLNAHLETVDPVLAKNGFILLQPVGRDERGNYVETMLLHKSGQWISSSMDLILARNDMQQAGSAITYARRYTLGALLGMSAEDDDGNAAVAKEAPKYSAKSSSSEEKIKSAVDQTREAKNAEEKANSSGFKRPSGKSSTPKENGASNGSGF